MNDVASRTTYDSSWYEVLSLSSDSNGGKSVLTVLVYSKDTSQHQHEVLSIYLSIYLMRRRFKIGIQVFIYLIDQRYSKAKRHFPPMETQLKDSTKEKAQRWLRGPVWSRQRRR
jgi:hypothetical protein